MRTKRIAGVLISASIILMGAAFGCGSGRKTPDTNAGFSPSDEDATPPKLPPPPCRGLQCQQTDCDQGEDTTVSGTVFAPNGTLPIYNAIVYVPNSEPDELPKGATCTPCGAVTGDPVVTALSEPNGAFTLKRVPVGTDIPLVIQVGKWRREVTIPEVRACVDNRLDDPELTRLPKTQAEGSMPRIGLTTGGCDNLGCILPKIGIDPSEFGTVEDGPSKSVHIFRGIAGGPSWAPWADSLWFDAAKMKEYDMLVMSCECAEHLDNKGGGPSSPAFAAMTEYLEAGGRIYTTDYMYTWYRYSSDDALKTAVGVRGGAPLGGSPMSIDTSFPKGQALYDWLNVVAPGSNGQVPASAVFGNLIEINHEKAQQWATSTASPDYNGALAGPRVFTVNVPVGVPADQQCGKGVHIDAHVSRTTGGSDPLGETYPASCPSKLLLSENLLAFFFFDLATCIQDENEPPKPPPVR